MCTYNLDVAHEVRRPRLLSPVHERPLHAGAVQLEGVVRQVVGINRPERGWKGLRVEHGHLIFEDVFGYLNRGSFERR